MLCFDDVGLPTAMTHTSPACSICVMDLEADDADETELRLPDASFGGAAYSPNKKYERDSGCRNARRDANPANST